MSKNKIFNIIILLFVMALLFICFLLSNKDIKSSKQTVATQGYIISCYNDKIAVFTQGDSVPIEVFDVYISTLPEKDQKDLKKGVHVSTKTRLRELIEDYTS